MIKKPDLDGMTPPKVQAVGIAWYEPADYPAIRAMMIDGHSLPATHGAWLQRARKGEQEFLAKGTRLVRVIIKPQPFAAWCALRGLNLDSAARRRFAAEHARHDPDPH